MKHLKHGAILWLLLGMLAWAGGAPHAWAHGGGTVHVAGEVAGPYKVTVWVAPNTVEAGKTLHFTVAVVQDESNEPVLDAQVLLDVLAAGTDTAVLSGPATTAQAVNKLFYEADFVAPAASGTYSVQAYVRGPEGEGTVSFDLAVEPAGRSNLLLWGLGGILLIAGLGVFLARRGEKARTAD